MRVLASVEPRAAKTAFFATLLAAFALCLPAVTPASAQDLTGTFYPVKRVYLLGEPGWFVFQVTNKGNSPVYIEKANPYGVCAFGSGYFFDVPGAPPTGPWKCGYIASCAGGGIERLASGSTYKQKLLLNQWFRIDQVGTYRVIARRDLRFSFHSNRHTLLAPQSQRFRTEFEMTVVKGDEATVRKAFEPYVKNLSSHEFETRVEAVETLTAMAPSFLEKTIIALATGHDSFAQAGAIRALGRLNTAESKRVLAGLIEDRQPYYSWQAIDALARTHDHSYVPLLEGLAKDPAWQNLAIPALGELGGESVVGFLAPLVYYPLGPPNKPPLQQLAIRGLANTGSREAIPYLIQALRNPLVQRDAVNGLERLTHLVIFQKNSRHWLYAKDDRTAEQVAKRWQRWWDSEGKKAKVYGPDDCASPPHQLPVE